MAWSLKRRLNVIPEEKIPYHIALIPDGNGRWAQKRGLPRSAGHRAGASVLKSMVRYLSEIKVKYFTVYAFSTENWSRPREEVDFLMNLLSEYLLNAENELKGTGVRLRVIGDRSRLNEKLIGDIENVEAMTSGNDGLNLVFAINYGSRDEIVQAVKAIIRDTANNEIKYENINKKSFESYLYTNSIPDPDLVIRTSGEYRTSNFLLWQTAYSEYVFYDVLWPDFTVRHMDEAIKQYSMRKRRYGGLNR